MSVFNQFHIKKFKYIDFTLNVILPNSKSFVKIVKTKKTNNIKFKLYSNQQSRNFKISNCIQILTVIYLLILTFIHNLII